MLLADLHMHSSLSHDGNNTIEEMCVTALEKELSYICITEHFDYIFDTGKHGYYNYEEHARLTEVAKKKHISGLSVLKGIEISQIHKHPEHYQYIKGLDLDMIIGSVHDFGPMFLGDPLLKEKYTANEIYEAYFNEILEMVRYGGFDVIGHLDFPARYIGISAEILPVVEIILNEALKKDILIEINTSPLRKSMYFTLPGEAILQMYSDCGGQYITTGSDAHRRADIAADFDTAEKLIYRYGLTPVYFKNRKMIPINRDF